MLRRVGEAPFAGWVIQGSLNLTSREWELCWARWQGKGLRSVTSGSLEAASCSLVSWERPRRTPGLLRDEGGQAGGGAPHRKLLLAGGRGESQKLCEGTQALPSPPRDELPACSLMGVTRSVGGTAEG